MTPEEQARQQIDAMLARCGWTVQDKAHINLSAGRGVAIREVSRKRGQVRLHNALLHACDSVFTN
jgi:type I restriction enzyme R subunit